MKSSSSREGGRSRGRGRVGAGTRVVSRFAGERTQTEPEAENTDTQTEPEPERTMEGNASPKTHNLDIPKAEFYYEFDDMNKISVKLSSKCFHIEAVEFLEHHMTEEEKKYFTEQSQFRHIFHMKKKQSLKMSLMVALINRSVKTKMLGSLRGTFTFNNVHEFVVNYLNKHRKPANQWNLPGFIIPLTMLPFECIPKVHSGGWYSEVRVEGNVKQSCPRMCRRCFIPKKKYGIRQGLTRIGRTQDIASILIPEEAESHLVVHLETIDNVDEVVDSWMAHLVEDVKSVKWRDILEADVKSHIEVPMMQMQMQKKRKAAASTRNVEKRRRRSEKGKRQVTYKEEEEEEEDQGDGQDLTSQVSHLKGQVGYLTRKLAETEKKLQSAIAVQGEQMKQAIEGQGEFMKKVIVVGMIAAGKYDNPFEVEARLDYLMKKMTELTGNKKAEGSARTTRTPPETYEEAVEKEGEDAGKEDEEMGQEGKEVEGMGEEAVAEGEKEAATEEGLEAERVGEEAAAEEGLETERVGEETETDDDGGEAEEGGERD
ncbi:PREDICTED: uncharacterized protein At3g43530-like [Tarenaya hassleriana]|uniref:uncharacterized protein At3g43530-like n=1 Tax=Tarenaya hassleriana TaxID=28532 RepID=UPI0008FD19BB|nr:PREDICTED: uncharacterized protein At3g43530-like [Tarenaya hassleriana]